MPLIMCTKFQINQIILTLFTVVRDKNPTPIGNRVNETTEQNKKKMKSAQTNKYYYYMVMTSFSFSNCTEELSFASFFYTQFENSNDVIPCNKCEQITPSYLLSVNQKS